MRLRSAKDLPPAGQRYDSPYDPQASYGNKRSSTWTGYKVHLTEACDEDRAHLITHVETTQAHISDVAQTEPIHKALANKALLPEAHVVDAGYVDGTLLLESLQDFGIELIGPVRPDVSWQYLLLLEPLSPTVASFRGFLHIPRKDSFQYATSESCVENMLFLLLSSS